LKLFRRLKWGGSWFEASLGEKARPHLQALRAKRAGGMAQGNELMCSKCKTLSSNPVLQKEKKYLEMCVYIHRLLYTHVFPHSLCS
jgi:hypothetical protein